jgi:hypothetical protein
MSWIKAHLKAIVAFCGFVGAGIASVTSGGIHGVLEWTVVLVALANAVQVYVTPNLDGAARFAKEISAVVLAVAGVLTPAVVDGGLNAHEWWMVVIAIAGALGVVIVPNVGARTRAHAAKV